MREESRPPGLGGVSDGRCEAGSDAPCGSGNQKTPARFRYYQNGQERTPSARTGDRWPWARYLKPPRQALRGGAPGPDGTWNCVRACKAGLRCQVPTLTWDLDWT